MKRLLIAVTLVVAGCTSTPVPAANPGEVTGSTRSEVYRYHDDELGVTCWVFDTYGKGGIHCILDREIYPNR